MTESKLPSAPWRVVREHESDRYPLRIEGADGQKVVGAFGACIDASPEVLRAVCALPLLVEATRKLVAECINRDMASANLDAACHTLALVDGEDYFGWLE